MSGAEAAPLVDARRGKLAGRSAVVSGASRGIGLAVAGALAREGAKVVMLARSAGELETRAREIGSAAVPIASDITDAAAWPETVRRIQAEVGPAPDILVNNAGRFMLSRVESTTAEEFRQALDVNLVGPFLLARTFLGDMRRLGRGHIVTIGSIADHVAFPENGAYAASKFGARGLHEVLRAELRGSGIRTTLVSPGPVDTTLWDAIDPDARPGFTPRRAMLRPSDVAAAVCFAVTQPDAVNVDELRISHS